MKSNIGARKEQALSDPLLTANIYLSGQLDQAIFRIVAPFWRALEELDPEQLCSVWMVRYDKGGEHLKVRLHGPAELRPRMQSLLEESARTYLVLLPGSPAPLARQGWVGAPPIDAEDHLEDHPDRSFLWTRYGRSHVSFGGKPFLDDDCYVSRMTACMGRGSKLVLALEPGEDGAIPHRLRQSRLLNALIGALSALGFSEEKRVQYLAYHRDWLLRFIQLKNEDKDIQPLEWLAHRCVDRTAGMERSLDILRRCVSAEWLSSDRPRRQLHPADAAWRDTLVDLLEYIEPFCADPQFHLDPLAPDPVFSPIFKVLHGLGNQLGLHLADEALAHHMLLAAMSPEQPFQHATRDGR